MYSKCFLCESIFLFDLDVHLFQMKSTSFVLCPYPPCGEILWQKLVLRIRDEKQHTSPQSENAVLHYFAFISLSIWHFEKYFKLNLCQ
jgi:hypothetical protein